MHYYFLINKPFGMLSQFTKEAPQHQVLGELHDFPPDVYPVGRLDRDSEGLLILTNDTSLNERLLHPKNQHGRKYWAQVEGIVTDQAIKQLETGVSFRAKGKNYRSAPLRARSLSAAETNTINPRTPPVRFRKSIPDAWLQLELTEGKNRQVRRICAAVGLPVLRLIRVGIVELSLADLQGQTTREVERKWLLSRLNL
jgi:23S rRNA pseudouridine2457 synthase